eukprot:TRINITY_DN6807_c0_g1_i1.p1 TRINITY_DN6807_c0_g1~~TRINITY_DN6807_c0_g1_i1.p1  ORF type:complete len:234 (+),score=26.19 TRINITY_DN6807_c0_g1_i1:88-702(+)
MSVSTVRNPLAAATQGADRVRSLSGGGRPPQLSGAKSLSAVDPKVLQDLLAGKYSGIRDHVKSTSLDHLNKLKRVVEALEKHFDRTDIAADRLGCEATDIECHLLVRGFLGHVLGELLTDKFKQKSAITKRVFNILDLVTSGVPKLKYARKKFELTEPAIAVRFANRVVAIETADNKSQLMRAFFVYALKYGFANVSLPEENPC